MNSLPVEEIGAGLAGCTVLYLQKANRSEYFRQLLLHGKKNKDWKIVVPGQAAHRSAFVDIVSGGGRYVDIPDFTQEQDWERNVEAVAEVEGRIAECERFSRVPANRLILSGARNIGRGFSVSRYVMPNSRLGRYVVADNNAGSLAIRRIFKFAFDLIDATRPSLIIAGEWNSPLYFATVLAARARGIKCLVNRNSKIVSGNFFWTSDLMMFNDRSRDALKELAKANAVMSAKAKDYIATFRNKPETLGFVAQKWDKRQRRGVKDFNLPYLRIFAAQSLARLRGTPLTQPDPAIGMMFHQYRSAVMGRLHRRFFRSYTESDLKGTRFVYLPLHKEGEIALIFQAPAWHDQANTVRLLSMSLPAGYKLLVREHRTSHGNRPTRWYRDVSRLPNVVLVNPFDSQFGYLKHAALVVTENGTSGWEGLLLGKRVLTLADSHYSGVGLHRHVADPSEVPAAVLDLLSRAPEADKEFYDRRLSWQIDAEHEHSFSGKVSDIPVAFDRLEAILR